MYFVRPSVCPYVSSAVHTVRISVMFDCGNVYGNLLIIRIWVKLGIIIGYFTCRSKYIFLLQTTFIRVKDSHKRAVFNEMLSVC